MNLRPLVILTLASCTIPATLAAQDLAATPATSATVGKQPTREQLLTLFQVMRIRTQMEQMLENLPVALKQQLESEEQDVEISIKPLGGELTPAQKAARDRVTERYFVLAEKQYPVDEMLNDLVEVYQRHITRDDVDGIIAFYRSTPGQHLLDAQPVMAKEVMPAVMKKLEERNRTLVERYKRELNDAMGPPKVQPPAGPKT